MSRRSVYKQGRIHTTRYGPKTDTTVVHWRFDWIELATTREEETDGPQKANNFKVKTWIKIADDAYTPKDDGVPGDSLQLTNQIQAAVDEIANKEASEAATLRIGSEVPEVKRESEPTTVEPTPEAMSGTE